MPEQPGARLSAAARERGGAVYATEGGAALVEPRVPTGRRRRRSGPRAASANARHRSAVMQKCGLQLRGRTSCTRRHVLEVRAASERARRSSTRSRARSGWRRGLEEALAVAAAGVASGQTAADLGRCAHAASRSPVAAPRRCAPVEQLRVQLLEAHARALVEGVGRCRRARRAPRGRHVRCAAYRRASSRAGPSR